MSNSTCHPLSRRAFLCGGTLLLTAASVRKTSLLGADDRSAAVRIGLVTDLHYADKPSVGTRHYRETSAKLAEAAVQFEKDRPDFLVELGDLIDAAETVATEQQWLARINREFTAICRDRHYVLGNHCVDMLTKAEFLDGVQQPKSFYSFDRNGFHFIVLDACFRADGVPYGRKNSRWDDANIPPDEWEWLRGDLADTRRRVIVFAHQRLDGADKHCVKNAAEVRSILQESRNVLAVFQGHSHQNDYKEIGGIHYCTLAAMVEGSGAESNGYSRLDVLADGSLIVQGFRRQKTYRWPGPAI
jgi:predicted phosphodiesterase